MSNIAVGIVGWGGGQIIIPAFTYSHPIANIPQLSATGLSLSGLALSSLSSGSKFWREKSVNIPIALSIGVPAVASSLIGSQIAKRLSGNVLALVFNGFSIVSIPVFFWIQQRRASKHYEDDNDQNLVGVTPQIKVKEIEHVKSANNDSNNNNKNNTNKRQIESCSSISKSSQQWLNEILSTPNLTKHISCGVACGIISSIIGVGGLPLTMSYLSESTHLSHHFVQGTALIALIPSIIFSTATKLHIMPVQTTVLVAFGGIIGGYAGAQFALDLTEEQLRFLYMSSLVLFGGRSMHGAIGNIRTLWFKKR